MLGSAHGANGGRQAITAKELFMSRMTPSSVSRLQRSTRSRIRRLSLESLESRCLLSVSAGAWDWEDAAIVEQYIAVDFDPPAELVAPDIEPVDVSEAALAAQAEVIAEANGLSTVASIHLSATDMNGKPLDHVQVGDTFLLKVGVEDGRMDPRGVFSMYFDLLYDSALMEVVGEIDHSDVYQSMPMGDASRPGILNDAGGFSPSLKPVGGGELPLFSIPMRAIAPGTALIAGDPADCNPMTGVGVYGEDESIDEARIDYGQVTLQIGSSGKPQMSLAELAKLGADGCMKPWRPVPPLESIAGDEAVWTDAVYSLDDVYSSDDVEMLFELDELERRVSVDHLSLRGVRFTKLNHEELQVLWLSLSDNLAFTSSASELELIPLIETTLPEQFTSTSAGAPANQAGEDGQEDSAETEVGLELLDEVFAQLGATELTKV